MIEPEGIVVSEAGGWGKLVSKKKVNIKNYNLKTYL